MRAAASRTFCTAGSSRPMRIAMMAITTNSSIKVKARRRDLGNDGIGTTPGEIRVFGREPGGHGRLLFHKQSTKCAGWTAEVHGNSVRTGRLRASGTGVRVGV